MTLPFDVCRCQDDACPRRDECLRWMERMKGGPRTPYRSDFRNDDGGCDAFVPIDDTTSGGKC